MSEKGTRRGSARAGTDGEQTAAATVPSAGTRPGVDGTGTVPPEGIREQEIAEAEEADGAGATPAGVPPPRPDTTSEPLAGTTRGRTWGRRVPQVLALAVVWVLLWGSFTPMALLGGLLIGLLVTLLFPLPVLPDRLPFRPLKAMRLVAYLAMDLAVSGVRVSLVSLLRGPRARSGIIGLPLYTDSDRAVTTIVAGCALTPGSYVLQIDRLRGRWYVYALGLHREGAVERVRGQMMNLQSRVIEALGSEEDVRRCRDAQRRPQ